MYVPCPIDTHHAFVSMCKANEIKFKKRRRHTPHQAKSTKGIPPHPTSQVLFSKEAQPLLDTQTNGVELDSGTVTIIDPRSGRGFDEVDDGDMDVMHAGSIKVKPLNKVCTGRLKANRDDDEGYGGFWSAVSYLMRKMVCQLFTVLYCTTIIILLYTVRC